MFLKSLELNAVAYDAPRFQVRVARRETKAIAPAGVIWSEVYLSPCRAVDRWAKGAKLFCRNYFLRRRPKVRRPMPKCFASAFWLAGRPAFPRRAFSCLTSDGCDFFRRAADRVAPTTARTARYQP